jgi:hypothetical protein
VSANWRPRELLSARALVGLDFISYRDYAFNAAGQGCTFCGQNRLGVRTVDKYESHDHTVDLRATASFPLTPAIGSRTSVAPSTRGTSSAER